MTPRELPARVLSRRAIVYVRQSTGLQVHENLESKRRQYALVDLAREYGFSDVSVIDEDLGRSASGAVERPGFRNLVGQICEGSVGAVLSIEVSRLSRNGRDWHHLLELCGMVGAYVIDQEGVYNPASPNDRLLLGLKGTMSEFELSLLRGRLVDAARGKARRGELRISVPVGYVWSRETGLAMDPDRRVQEAIRSVFRLFERLGSGHQVLKHMRAKGSGFPRPSDGKSLEKITFSSPVYRNVISVLTNPFSAGAYAYGKSRVQTIIVDGAPRKTYGRTQPRSDWIALIRDHHEGYITWERFEQIQERLSRNSYRSKAGAAKRRVEGRPSSRACCDAVAAAACSRSPMEAGGSPSPGTPAGVAPRCRESPRASLSGPAARTRSSGTRSSLRFSRWRWMLPSWPHRRNARKSTNTAGHSIWSDSNSSTRSSSQNVATRLSIPTTAWFLWSWRHGGMPPWPV